MKSAVGCLLLGICLYTVTIMMVSIQQTCFHCQIETKITLTNTCIGLSAMCAFLFAGIRIFKMMSPFETNLYHADSLVPENPEGFSIPITYSHWACNPLGESSDEFDQCPIDAPLFQSPLIDFSHS